MKKAYLYLLIGVILLCFSLGIVALDLIIHIAGYGLMILGITLILQQRQSAPLMMSKQLTIGLLIFELLKSGIARAVISNTILATGIMTLILVVQLAIFYLIIKAEGDASESLEVQTYQQATLLFSIALLSLYLISYFSTFVYFLFTTLDLYFLIFIIYVFYKIRAMYHF